MTLPQTYSIVQILSGLLKQKLLFELERHVVCIAVDLVAFLFSDTSAIFCMKTWRLHTTTT